MFSKNAVISVDSEHYRYIGVEEPLLQKSAREGDFALVQELISQGMDVNEGTFFLPPPLHYAAINGHIEVMKLLLSHGAKIRQEFGNKEVYHNANAFHFAAMGGNISAVQTLLELDSAVVNIKTSNPLKICSYDYCQYHVKELIKFTQFNKKWDYSECLWPELTALHIAALLANIDLTLCLIEAGADIHAVDYYGFTPLHYAAISGNIELVHFLLDTIEKNSTELRLKHYSFSGDESVHDSSNNDSDDDEETDNKEIRPNKVFHKYVHSIEVQDRSGLTPLFIAARAGNYEICQALILRGAKIDASDRNQMTILHYAAQSGITSLVQSLLKSGFDVNIKSFAGITPLHCAANSKCLATFELLLAYGADIHAEATDQQVDEWIKEDTFGRYEWKDKTSVLLCAARANFIEAVTILLEKGVNPNASNINLITPLHYAIPNENGPMLDLLLAHGAMVNACDAHDVTPLHLAASRGKVPHVETLLAQAAILDAADQNGDTPLFYAIENKQIAIVELLLKSGANCNHQNKKGRTPLHCAVFTSHEIVQLLLAHGADCHIFNNQGLLPLHCLSNAYNLKLNPEKIIKTLLDAGTEIDALSEFGGGTPLTYAAESGSLKVLEALLKNGANPNIMVRKKNIFCFARGHDVSDATFYTETRRLLARNIDKLSFADLFVKKPIEHEESQRMLKEHAVGKRSHALSFWCARHASNYYSPPEGSTQYSP